MFFQLGTGDMLQHTMEAAGFADLIVQRLSATLRFASADEALGAAFVGGPVALAYSRFDRKVRDEVHVEYLDSIRVYRRGDGYDVPGEFVVARGMRQPRS